MKSIYEVTLKKNHPNPMSVIGMSLTFENVDRTEAVSKAMNIAESLGLIFDMSYVIRLSKEIVE